MGIGAAPNPAANPAAQQQVQAVNQRGSQQGKQAQAQGNKGFSNPGQASAPTANANVNAPLAAPTANAAQGQVASTAAAGLGGQGVGGIAGGVGKGPGGVNIATAGTAAQAQGQVALPISGHAAAMAATGVVSTRSKANKMAGNDKDDSGEIEVNKEVSEQVDALQETGAEANDSPDGMGAASGAAGTST